MACADLTVELGKEAFKMDGNQEKQITSGIVKLLEDDHSQVQELAVKTYFLEFVSSFSGLDRSL